MLTSASRNAASAAARNTNNLKAVLVQVSKRGNVTATGVNGYFVKTAKNKQHKSENTENITKEKIGRWKKKGEKYQRNKNAKT